jgi:hypothetical protein
MGIMDKIGHAANQGVPLVGVRTADQNGAKSAIGAGFASAKWGVVAWDMARGALPGNTLGEGALAALVQGLDDPSETLDPVVTLGAALRGLPERSALVMSGAHRLLDPASHATGRIAQAVLNLRDAFAQTSRMLVLVGPSIPSLPELGSDVYLIDEPLPDEAAREAIVGEISDAADVELDAATKQAAVRSTRGLSAFAAQQVVALSAHVGERLDLASLQSQWIEVISAVPGLSVDISGKTLSDVAGLSAYKAFAQAYAKGKNPADTVIQLEEAEKAFSGATGPVGDSSGVTQGIMGQLLTWMEEKNATGIIAVGPPGSGKSLCSVATGAACGAPTVRFDVGALKGSLVGQSEEQARNALRTLDSFAGRTFWIATCNSLAAIPPEFRRRFRFGVWFFDLPSAEERAALWSMYTARCGVANDLPENDRGWSGAEIRNCCEMARDLSITPREAAAWVVPAAVSSSDAIEALRQSAAGKYLSASEPGPYVYRGPIASAPTGAAPAKGGRQMGGFGGAS